jgi:hypothetical protein
MAHSAGYYLGEGTKTLVPMTVARVAVAPGDSTSSLKKGANATRRWTREETKARAIIGPEFSLPSPAPAELDEQVRGYEQVTGEVVSSQPKRNLIAACYRVHGDNFLPLVRAAFERTGTATNLLGEMRRLPPRQTGAPTGTATDATATTPCCSPNLRPNESDTDSAWCGCPEEALRPGLLYCAAHYRYGYAGELRMDRRSSNAAAAAFFAARDGRTCDEEQP